MARAAAVAARRRSYNPPRMRILSWVLRAIVFFVLFAFALNNQGPVVVHWFFGIDWQAPLVIVVLLAFAAGCAVGVLAMLPGWWRARRRAAAPTAMPAAPAPTLAGPASGFDGGLPPREGL
jgi:lipopolysaccharide assembly protein A